MAAVVARASVALCSSSSSRRCSAGDSSSGLASSSLAGPSSAAPGRKLGSSVENLLLCKIVRGAGKQKVGSRVAAGVAAVGGVRSAGVNVQNEKNGKQSTLQENEDAKLLDLKEWMHAKGLPQCKVQLLERTCFGSNGKPIHYVAANEDLQPGDVALSVPLPLVVSLERVLGDETLAELLTTNKLSELACLALYLMYEKKQGKDSFWYPYIRELDRQRGRGQLSVPSPLLWSPQELNEYFTGSPMKKVVLERLEGIKREYNELDTVWFMAGSLFKQYPFDIPTEAFSFEIFKQAFVAVQSCVVHLQGVSLARRFCLVPLGPPLLGYKSNCRAMLKAVGDVVQLEVDRAYKAGDPLVVWCGPQPNSRLLLNYGFVDEDNPHDRLTVEAALETKDPLYQNKRITVQKHNLSTIQTFQIFKGKERDAMLSMLPYLRLAHISNPEDMQAVGSAEGAICATAVSPCNERAVLDQLKAYFSKRLSGYLTTVEQDTVVIEDENVDPKKRVATKLLRIEKEILGNALTVVKELIEQLPNGTVAPCNGSYIPKLV
ncbi:hypothetical protein MPTK1_8g11790 [Marchantia polymorpha subsp. ruderalis]|uniref:Rubisco LSMT substrate-binding domain-containing protein n=2 Tax=Marchantia polymorpha TaxID=3197 RepID=A0A176WC59_MARPO|nr:hypothetical protein AXG93_4876s1110 [Marchantia polymorpha subsp. ruderalis]PTQ47251.1 hypothetical protein MARPO_0008s0037 [Marchantia polymorpha]BBN19573.1 hypothetical protein Mp_8g11790 [Marchantia polymorpha subsp. ruderalis]|eukprot:PTQ47251.1 hypothetical protein MARPO_0008s0037 [Marchantia polymorpha]